MARSYKRDKNGRFAGGGGGSGGGSGGKKSAGGGGAKKAPKTTSARGRAKSNATAARAAIKAGGGKKAQQSLMVAERASRRYKATGTGTKRSPVKGSGGSKPAKGTVAKAKPAPKAGVAERKKAMSREVTRTMLGGKATAAQRNSQRERYIGAQNSNQYATSNRGKGSKAARRAAALKR